jgi:hypothetical protein
VLEVRKDPDTLALGSCKYAVLRIDRSLLDDKSRPMFMETDYYAPDLKLIIAKEYRESDGRTTLNKYDKIYQSPRWRRASASSTADRMVATDSGLVMTSWTRASRSCARSRWSA